MKFIILFGVVVHLILLAAVFKIYFTSPLEHDLVPHKSGVAPPAKRLVLFVADGLRAQSLYNNQFQKRASFLSSKVKLNGAWGVAHTHMPTESRPGHVAILAGFSEDPGAITKGWQANPVEYDSVINQSTNAWCWGSPDIVKLFGHGKASHIHLSHYNPEAEDFSGKESTTLLDKWVFDEVKDFVKMQYKHNCTNFCSNGNILFLHLLGLDTAGHSFTPLSGEYTKNIVVVDHGIKEVSQILDNFFNDSGTTYIFTSDHGMTNWGSHGDGSEHETSVPFIAWGAGIESFPKRQDLQQSEIAPLIASLIGINIPIHSKAMVPLNYINATLEQKAHILYANAAQLLEQYKTKQKKLKKQSIPYLFKPFPGLSETEAIDKLKNNFELIKLSKYKESVKMSSMLIKQSQSGLQYYKSYFQKTLLNIMGFGYFGWILFALTSITDLETMVYYQALTKYKHLRMCVFENAAYIFGALGILMANIVFLLDLDYDFYIYFLFPVTTWYCVVRNYKKAVVLIDVLSTYTWQKLVLLASINFIGIEILVYTFFEPRMLFFVFVLLAIQAYCFVQNNFSTNRVWVISLLVFGLAPSIIGIQSEFSRTFQVLTMIGWLLIKRHVVNNMTYTPNKKIVTYQIGLLLVAFINTIFVDYTISHGFGLWSVNKYISWIILCTSLILPLFTLPLPGVRCGSAIIGFVTVYTLMSTGCESFFMICLAMHMYNWCTIEKYNNKLDSLPSYIKYLDHIKNYTDENTTRQCFFLLSFIMLGFFGLGNMASLSSFNPKWVRCFVTLFSPITMAILIIIKLLIPFLVVLSAFREVVNVSHFHIRNCFLIILVFCNLMVIQFFYFIKDEGSWLEMGLSLSRFIVAIVTTIALIVLYGITGLYGELNIIPLRINV